MSKDSKLPSVKRAAHDDQPCLAICAGKHCAKSGLKQLRAAAATALQDAGIHDSVAITLTKCQDHCDDGPVATVFPARRSYLKLSPTTIRQLIVEHVYKGKPVPTLKSKRFKD